MDQRAKMQEFLKAQAHHQAGRLAEAERGYRKLLQVDPDFPHAIHFLGVIAQQAGDLKSAAQLMARSVELNPNSAIFHCNLGNVLKEMRRFDKAIVAYQQALRCDPTNAESMNNLANTLREVGKVEQAISLYRQAIRIRPNYFHAHNNLAVALHRNRQYAEAMASLERTLELAPDYSAAHINLGVVYHAAGEYELALKSHRRGLELSPDSVEAVVNLATTLQAVGQLDAAIKELRRLIASRPDFAAARHNLALVLLLSGQFEEGWKEFEWRWRFSGFASPGRKFSQPAWNGEPIEGKTLLIHAEQGMGDTIHFLRYLPVLTERLGVASGRNHLLLESDTPLVPLFQKATQMQCVSFAPRGELSGNGLPPFDLHLPLMSLPLMLHLPKPLDISNESIIHVPTEVSERWKAKLRQGDRKRVGLAWAGSAIHQHDLHRSIGFEQLAPLLNLPIDFYSLQVPRRRANGQEHSNLIDLTADIGSFLDTAGLISHLDLILCVDSAVAHLAGSMGKPTWIFIPYAPDWRWRLERSDSDWYPTARLFRQNAPGNWAHTIAEVKTALQQRWSL